MSEVITEFNSSTMNMEDLRQSVRKFVMENHCPVVTVIISSISKQELIDLCLPICKSHTFSLYSCPDGAWKVKFTKLKFAQ